MRRLMCLGAVLAALGCDSADRDTVADDDTASIAPSKPAAPSTSAAPAAAGIETFGGEDWKAVFQGEPPVKLQETSAGGQGTGMSDDHTVLRGAPYKQPGWKYGAAGGGGVFWSATKKVAIVENYNIKLNPTAKTIDLWIKSALVKNVKHSAGPEVIEVGPKKSLALAGAGSCTMKDGQAADFYWRDVYSAGDFSHDLSIVVVSKDASDDEKKVALSALRQFEYTDKLKPHYKK